MLNAIIEKQEMTIDEVLLKATEIKGCPELAHTGEGLGGGAFSGVDHRGAPGMGQSDCVAQGEGLRRGKIRVSVRRRTTLLALLGL